MAIERTYIYGTDTAELIENFYNYLNENAVPEYFDEVKIITDGHMTVETVACYRDGKFIAEFYCYYGSAGVAFFKYLNDTEWTEHQIVDGGWFKYAYKCKNGLSFSTSATNGVALTITKDNAGNTTFVYAVSPNASDTSIIKPTINTSMGFKYSHQCWRFVCISPEAHTVTFKTFAVIQYLEQMTVLCPIPVADTPNYTPNVFFTPYIQHAGHGIIDIDGCKYLTNGLWCVKDGA